MSQISLWECCKLKLIAYFDCIVCNIIPYILSFSPMNKRRVYVKKIIKINFISILYALSLFTAIELIINVYRISRVTGWNLDIVMVIIPIVIVIGLIFSTLLIIRLIKKWMLNRKIGYGLAFIWCPYFILFYYIFTYLFPLASGETWFPIFNILIYGIIFLYPFYILIINRYVTSEK